MSYDIYLRGTPDPCPTCGHTAEEPELPNPTYNLTAIFDLLLTGEALPNPYVGEGAVVVLGKKTDRPRGLRVLSGLRAADTIEMISKALDRALDPAWRARLIALEPSNGWGTLQGAREVLTELIRAAMEHPNNMWEIH